jgi:rubrerythrin
MTDNQHSDVQKIFDKTFSSHMERLVGAKHGIEELPFGLVNLSCLIFLLEREGELHGSQDDSIKPYTSKTLSIELMEMGIALNGDLIEIIEDFVQKGYVFINDSGQLSPRKPVASTVKLIERAFPKMPGMTLVGYFLQTIDEVTSKRKNLKEAVSQFDQTLSIHGVSLVEQGGAEEKAKRGGAEEKNRNGAGARDTSKKQWAGTPLEGIHHRRRRHDIAKSGVEGVGPKSSEPTILSSNPYHSGVRIQKVQFGQVLVKETDSEKDDDDIPLKNKIQDVETPEEYIPESPVRSTEHESPAGGSEPHPDRREDLQIETVVEKKSINSETMDIPANPAADHHRTDKSLDLPDSDKQESMTMSAVSQRDERILSDQHDLKNKGNGDESESETAHDQFPNEPTAELVEKRIADFEEDLAKECPMCKKGRISAEETSTGKLYYTCSNRECGFISWGKPYHIVCPKCQNPFLIEVPGREGKNILKCPRATCRHWQTFSFQKGDFIPEASQRSAYGMPGTINNLPKAKKRVVRKRRVRRKR